MSPNDYVIHHARRFAPGVPVHLWTRYAYRADLALHPAFKVVAMALILTYARRCKVRVHAIAILDNHLHLIVSQGRIRRKHWRTRGIWPFVRNWKSRLSTGFRALDLAGCKFERVYQSASLWTLEEYLAKYAYVCGQAIHHRASPEDVILSRRVLDGDLDGVVDVVPDLYPKDGIDQCERARRFGELVDEVIAAAAATDVDDESRPTESRRALEVRRRRRRRFEVRRDAAGRLSQVALREASARALSDRGLDGASSTVDLASFHPRVLDRPRWNDAVRALVAFRLPPTLAVTHVRDGRGRVTQTHIDAAGVRRTIEWSMRIDFAPARGPD